MSEESIAARLSRDELALTSALDKVAMMADKQPAVFWFRTVFKSWMSPQGCYRRWSVQSVFQNAIDAINEIEEANEDYSI